MKSETLSGMDVVDWYVFCGKKHDWLMKKWDR